jgi:hypothetical protein
MKKQVTTLFIVVRLASEEQVAFADVFCPMLVGGFEAKQRCSPDYMISGKDGVHPGWAGHLVMAYAFLNAMGLDGQIGTITLDLTTGKATASEGHRVLATEAGRIEVESSRYPFCATGPANEDSSIRSGMTFVPFNSELNRFLLVVRNAPSGRYTVTWGETSKTYRPRNGPGHQPGGGLRDRSFQRRLQTCGRSGSEKAGLRDQTDQGPLSRPGRARGPCHDGCPN